MLIDKLKTWTYYLNKFPLYLRNSYGFTDHFKILFDLLVQLDLIEDDILKAFDVMSDNYLSFINHLSEDETSSDILDKVAALYGVTRYFNVNVDDEDIALALTNAELLMLIKARIIQFNFDGTYIMTKQFYESIKLPVLMYNSATSTEAKLFLDISQLQQSSDNIVNMFKAGLFTIQSLGISYITEVTDTTVLLVWDSSSASRLWDVGKWL